MAPNDKDDKNDINTWDTQIRGRKLSAKAKKL